MFQIELTLAIALYAFVLAGVIAAIWIYTELSVHRPQRALGRQFLWRCTYCGSSYLDESAKNISQCPRCKSYNALEEEKASDSAEDAGETMQNESHGRRARNPSQKKRYHQRRRGPRRRR